MNKTQIEAVTIEMMKTIGYVRDAEKNADAYYSADQIKNNMLQYFTGLAFVLGVATGKEYHWSNGTDGKTWALVIQDATGDRYISL